MAARGMTGHHRLCVLQFPSLTEAGWIDAIRNHAADIGWSVHDLAVENDWPAEPLDGSAIFFTTGLNGVERLDPTHWIILTEDPSASAALVSTVLGVGLFDHASIVHTSIRLALSAQIADREASVEILDARARRLCLSALGWVERTLETPRADPELTPGPLDFFERLPIPVGSSIDWDPVIFNYPAGKEMDGGSPDIDLTGRARVLLFGPFVYLPEGSWSVDIDVSVDPQSSTVVLMFEWGGEDHFVSHTTSVTLPGQYRITLNRRWSDLRPSQIRIWLTQPLFQGHLIFNGCRLTRVLETTPETTTLVDRTTRTIGIEDAA